ncbi:MAG: hypothetical protein ACE5JI_18080 [Acidobacteriota bacterium]
MFLGHFAVGLGTKWAAPKVSLGTLFLAAQFTDLLLPTFLLVGLEAVRIQPGVTAVTPLDFFHYPISHSLAAAVMWALLFGLVYGLVKRYSRGVLVLALAVASHWFLHFLTHRPDLPLYPGGSRLVGLGLWSSLWGTLAVELVIFAIGIWLYVRSTRATDRAGLLGFWGLVLFLLVVYLANLYGPPPPSVSALAWVGQAQWLIVIWGYWVDRHRQLRY